MELINPPHCVHAPPLPCVCSRGYVHVCSMVLFQAGFEFQYSCLSLTHAGVTGVYHIPS